MSYIGKPGKNTSAQLNLKSAVEATGQAERVKFENYSPDFCGLTPSLNN
jgi:hypothetical protein